MKNKIIKFNKFIAIVFLFGMVFTISPFPSYALSETEKQIQDYIITDPNKMSYPSECKTDLISGNPDKGIKGFEKELQEFMEFLDANFKNKSSTSSLTSLAIARYREYRDALRKQFKHVQIAGSRKAEAATNEGEFATSGAGQLPNFEAQMKNYALCEEMVNTYISLGRQEMIKHIKKSAAQKKTIMLLEKYKALNTKLRNLNMNIAQMFGLFKTFEKKFEVYICEKCMKKL